MSFSKRALCIAFLGWSVAFTVNEWNRSTLVKTYSAEQTLYRGVSILNGDNASYLVPPENWLTNGVWKDNSLGLGSYFQRPPGYGLVYLFFRSFCSQQTAMRCLLQTQLLLFGLSLYCFSLLLSTALKNQLIATSLALLYATLPMSMNFLYYGLTEGITPQLLIFLCFFCWKAHRTHHTPSLYIAACLGTLLVVTRPVLLPFLGVLVVYGWKTLNKSFSNKLIHLALIGLISISGLLAWQVRNYRLAERYVGLHPIYFEQNNSIFRATHGAVWEFAKCWGEEGSTFHGYMVPLWENTIRGNFAPEDLDQVLNHIPTHIQETVNKKELHNAFDAYVSSIKEQAIRWKNQEAMPNQLTALEQDVIQRFSAFTGQCKSAFFWDYHVAIPARVFQRLVAHSNMSLFIFQATYRGTWWAEALRFICFGLHVLGFLSIPVALFLIRRNPLGWMLGISLLYLLFLCWYQRGVEERYTLPVLWCAFLSLGIVLDRIFSYRFGQNATG